MKCWSDTLTTWPWTTQTMTLVYETFIFLLKNSLVAAWIQTIWLLFMLLKVCTSLWVVRFPLQSCAKLKLSFQNASKTEWCDVMIRDPKKQMFRHVSHVKSLQVSMAVDVLNFGRFLFSIATCPFAVIIANWGNVGVLWKMCRKGKPLICRSHV